MKLGHLNIKSMRKIIVEKDIVGIPDLKIEEGKIGGDFQFGKKTKMYHYNMQHLTINRVLELLHMSYETYASWKS